MAEMTIAGALQIAQYAYLAYSIYTAVTAEPKKVEGPSLNDLRVLGMEYGYVLPVILGHRRTAGWLAWASPKRKISHTTTSGGKGNPGVETTTFTYEVDLWIVLTDNICAGVSRGWDNGKLCFSQLHASDAASIVASEETNLWRRLTFYDGGPTQMPDPTYEAAVGVDNATALRGRSSLFIEGLQLDSGGNLRNLSWEVQSRYNGPNTTLTATTLPASTTWASGGLAYMPSVNKWVTNNGGTTKAYSADGGVTWNSGSGGSDGSAATIANSIAAITGPSGGGHFQRTTDGVNWSDATRPGNMGSVGRYPLAVAPNGDFVCASMFGGVGHIHTSPTAIDSASWTDQGGAPVADSTGFGMIRSSAPTGGTRMLLVQGRSGSATASAFYSDNNGVTWTAITLPYSKIWTTMCWNGRVWMLFDWGTGTLITSPTGVTGSWTLRPTLPETGQWWNAEALIGGGVWANTLGNSNFWYTIDDGDTWQFVTTPVSSAWRQMATDGYRIVVISTSDNDVVYSDGYALFNMNDETVKNTFREILLLSGMSEDQFDILALSAITTPQRGFALTQIEPPRNSLATLCGRYFIECTLSDKAYFRPRGGSSVATAAYLDLGATLGDEPGEPFIPRIRSDIELPAYFEVSYINVNKDYQRDVQRSDRLITSQSDSIGSVSVPLAMTESEAKAFIDAYALDNQVALIGGKVSLLTDYTAIESGDPFVVTTDTNGSTMRVRAVSKADSFPVHDFDVVMDDASALVSLGITSADYTMSTTVIGVPLSLKELMDIPITRDADNDPGFYVTMKGVTTPWPGGVLYGSREDVQFEDKARVEESGVFGTCTTTLGDWDGPYVFDETNSVTVDLGNGTTASSTRAACLADPTLQVWLIGSELIQAVTATLVSPGVYKLTRLLRGLRGTEWAMTGHVASERAVRIQMTGLRRVSMQNDEIGALWYYRAITYGRNLDSDTSEQFTNNAIGLKPFSPTNLRAAFDGTDVAITWDRRSRLATRGISTTGQSIPLGEGSERYEVDIADVGAPNTILRTLGATDADRITTNAVTYTAAMIAADSTTPGSIVYRVYQISESVGRGYPLRKTA